MRTADARVASGGFEVQFERFLQVGQCLLLRLPLARNVNLETLGDVPVAFPPNRRRERTFHNLIVIREAMVVSGRRVGEVPA